MPADQPSTRIPSSGAPSWRGCGRCAQCLLEAGDVPRLRSRQQGVGPVVARRVVADLRKEVLVGLQHEDPVRVERPHVGEGGGDRDRIDAHEGEADVRGIVRQAGEDRRHVGDGGRGAARADPAVVVGDGDLDRVDVGAGVRRVVVAVAVRGAERPVAVAQVGQRGARRVRPGRGQGRRAFAGSAGVAAEVPVDDDGVRVERAVVAERPIQGRQAVLVDRRGRQGADDGGHVVDPDGRVREAGRPVGIGHTHWTVASAGPSSGAR